MISRALGQRFTRQAQARPASLAGLAVLAVVGGLALAAGSVDGSMVDAAARGGAPTLGHPLGTDHLGRDILSRLIGGTRAFALPGALAVCVCAPLAVAAGAALAWLQHGAWVGPALDALAALPRVVLVLLVATVLGMSPVVLGTVAGLSAVPGLAHAIAGRVQRMRQQDYVLAARGHGFSDARILWVHLIGIGCAGIIGRHLVQLVASVLILETTLSYLGFGVPQPHPSWGNMLAFDWGHDVSLTARLAPAAAIWAGIVAAMAAGDVFGEAS